MPGGTRTIRSTVVRGATALVLTTATVLVTTGATGPGGDTISGTVKLPPGATSATVTVQPLDPSTTGTELVTSGVTDAGGRFTVSVPTGPRVTALRAANGGVLNLDATETAEVGGRLWVATVALSRGGQRGASTLFTSKGALPANQLRLTPVEYPLRAAPVAVPRKEGCVPGWTGFVNDTPPTTSWDVIDEIHAYYDVRVKTLYDVGAGSDFGVGLSVDDSHWSVSGTAHVGNNTGSGQETGLYGPFYGHRIEGEFTGVKRHRYYNDCIHPLQIQYQVYLYLWQGGLREGTDLHIWDGCDGNGQGYCHQPISDTAVIIRGGHYYRTTGHTYDYGPGISLFGITLGGTTTFSTGMQIDMLAGTGVGVHEIFGHGAPPASAGAIYSY